VELLATGIGLLGVTIVLVAYGLLTAGKLNEHDARYYWLNIAGTVGITISLLVQWNLAAMVAQLVWMLVSVAALWRIRRRA